MRHAVIFFLSLILCLPAGSNADAAKRRQVDRYASIVIDASTGYVLSERNADKKLYPASLTKMMTLYLAFSALEQGTLRKNDRLPVSRHAAAQVPSKLGLKYGDTIRVEDAILALVTKSANDVAVAFAETIGGSERSFARLMTLKARALGMKNTNFTNASGLHEPQQVSSARDIAILSQALIRDFPREYRYFSTNSFTYAGARMDNHNKLLKSYTGMDGIKTGYVGASGYNLAASAVQGGKRLIGVVFGGRSPQSRNLHMAGLMDAGFDRAGEPRIASAIGKRQSSLQMAGAVRLPVKKPAVASLGLTSNTMAPAMQMALAAGYKPPAFNALNLVPSDETGEGDSAPKVIHFPGEMEPKRLNTKSVGAWAVQVGAFSSHDASMIALRHAKEQLPGHIAARGEDIVVPLMTSRGMIYRARLGGLQEKQASDACGILRGSCLVLASQ